MKPTEELAKFIVNTTFENLPKEAVHHAKLFVLESAAASLLGSTSNAGRKMANILLGLEEKGEAKPIGLGTKTSCRTAAFYNAFTLDLNDSGGGSDLVTLHPGKNIVPAALPVASFLGRSGKDLITAIEIGIEAGTRINRAMFPSHVLRGHYDDGTIGCFGATAAVGKLFGLDSVKMTDAFGNAGAVAPTTLGGSFMLRSYSRSAGIGQGAASGVFSVIMANNGIGGPRNILECEGGFCSGLSDNYDLSKITEGLGKEYLIIKSYFKPHLGCRLSHGVRECALVLREKYKIDLSDIAKVTVKMSELGNYALNFSSTPEEMEQNVTVCGSYLVAAALLYGEVGPEIASEKRLKDPKIYELMDKIEIVIDPGFSKEGFIPTGGAVEVITKDGKRFSHSVDEADWSSNRRPTDEHLADKFRIYASGALSKEQIEKAIEMTFKLEEVNNTVKLMDLFCPEK